MTTAAVSGLNGTAQMEVRQNREGLQLHRDISAGENHEHKEAMATTSFLRSRKALKMTVPCKTRNQFDRNNYVLNTPTGTIDAHAHDTRTRAV